MGGPCATLGTGERAWLVPIAVSAGEAHHTDAPFAFRTGQHEIACDAGLLPSRMGASEPAAAATLPVCLRLAETKE